MRQLFRELKRNQDCVEVFAVVAIGWLLPPDPYLVRHFSMQHVCSTCSSAQLAFLRFSKAGWFYSLPHQGPDLEVP